MLNRQIGEIIEGMPGRFVVVPNAKWRDTPMWEEACRAAVAAFRQSGALMPIWFGDDDVLTQEYPEAGKIAFVFHRRVAGQSKWYPYVFTLSPKALADLRQVGRWANSTTH